MWTLKRLFVQDGARRIRAESVPLRLIGGLLRNEGTVVFLLSLSIVAMGGLMLRFAGNTLPAFEWFLRNIRLYVIIWLLAVLLETSIRLLVDRPEKPASFLVRESFRKLLCRRLAALPSIFAVAIFMPAFSAMKSSIGRLNDFKWDTTFIMWDRALHGTDPWRILQPIMGFPEVTYAASTLYHAWFLLIYAGPVAVAFFVRSRALRLRFFLAYLGSWTIVGMVFATLFASVGPVFAEPILGIDTFAQQTAYLKQANTIYPIAVVDVQAMLLEWYRAGDYGLGRGITAMPSMHVALAWLYVLAMWRIDRRLGIGFAVFFAGIMLSSVHLAYHYAVDGYVAVALVSLIWWASGQIAWRCLPDNAVSKTA